MTSRRAVDTGEFTVAGQLRLYEDTGRDDVIRQAEYLAPAVDAVGVTDLPYRVLHMSGLAVASILLQHGIDPLMLAAAALGVTSFLLQRGERVPGENWRKWPKFSTPARRSFAPLPGSSANFR